MGGVERRGAAFLMIGDRLGRPALVSAPAPARLAAREDAGVRQLVITTFFGPAAPWLEAAGRFHDG
jgi:hypothetical protein